jgi:flagellar motor switch protein FliN/FliY
MSDSNTNNPAANPGTASAVPSQPLSPDQMAARTAADAAQLLEQTEAALKGVENSMHGPKPSPFVLEELVGEGGPPEKISMDLLHDVDLDLKIELGRANMHLDEVLKLRKGSVVALEKLAGDPVDVYVNGRLVARGEVLVLNDNFCVRIAQLVGSDSPLEH